MDRLIVVWPQRCVVFAANEVFQAVAIQTMLLARGLCYQLLNLLLPDLFVEDSVMLWLRFFVGLLYFYSPSFASL